MDGAQPEREFEVGLVEDVVCTMQYVKGFGWRFVPYLRPTGSDRYLGVAKAREGLRSYADMTTMVGWLRDRFKYAGIVTVIPLDHKMVSDLRLVAP